MSLQRTFSALADPTRQKILELLKKDDMTAGKIASNFAMSLPSISHHLSILKNADLVSTRRNGQEIIYSLNETVFEEVAGKIMKFFTK
jgi:DNA-binding transcriptional ArsR family regulator